MLITYKSAVKPYFAQLLEWVQGIGSVNKVMRREEGSLYGDNTDVLGFAAMVDALGLPLEGKKALVLGSGGASLTACYLLRQRGAIPVVISRGGENHYQNLHLHADAALVVNTTPVGMYPNNGAVPLSLARFPHCEGLLDLIYNPARTALMLEAEELGIPCVGGLSMLVWQAVAAAEAFTQMPISRERGEETLRAVEGSMENLILLGMPGSGKSTVGREVARQWGRPFVDADEYLVEQVGKSIPELFAQEGEEGFRRRETQILRELGKRSGLVIATGGGCVTRAENYALLRQNGRMVYLERDTALLEREGRPLSQGADLEGLRAQRLPLYRRFAQGTVENQGSVAAVAERVKEVFYEAAHS